MSDLILREDRGHIARLTLNNPSKFNALSLEMIDALSGALRSIASDDNLRVVILAANGKAYSAGHDLRQMQEARQNEDAGRQAFDQLFERCAGMMQMIHALPQPVIAEVQGIATAAGCQLVASCDMVVAAQGVRFGVNGVNIGLFCSTPMVALSRVIPPKAAFEMLTTGEFITSERAQELGLVNRVVVPENLTQATTEMAEGIATKLPEAVRMGKRAFYDQLHRALPDAYDHAGATMCENMLLPDTDEGIAAFLEKRSPRWS